MNATFRVPDPVGERFVLAQVTQHSFPGFGFQLLGIHDVDESSNAEIVSCDKLTSSPFSRLNGVSM